MNPSYAEMMSLFGNQNPYQPQPQPQQQAMSPLVMSLLAANGFGGGSGVGAGVSSTPAAPGPSPVGAPFDSTWGPAGLANWGPEAQARAMQAAAPTQYAGANWGPAAQAQAVANAPPPPNYTQSPEYAASMAGSTGGRTGPVMQPEPPPLFDQVGYDEETAEMVKAMRRSSMGQGLKGMSAALLGNIGRPADAMSAMFEASQPIGDRNVASRAYTQKRNKGRMEMLAREQQMKASEAAIRKSKFLRVDGGTVDIEEGIYYPDPLTPEEFQEAVGTEAYRIADARDTRDPRMKKIEGPLTPTEEDWKRARKVVAKRNETSEMPWGPNARGPAPQPVGRPGSSRDNPLRQRHLDPTLSNIAPTGKGGIPQGKPLPPLTEEEQDELGRKEAERRKAAGLPSISELANEHPELSKVNPKTLERIENDYKVDPEKTKEGLIKSGMKPGFIDWMLGQLKKVPGIDGAVGEGSGGILKTLYDAYVVPHDPGSKLLATGEAIADELAPLKNIPGDLAEGLTAGPNESNPERLDWIEKILTPQAWDGAMEPGDVRPISADPFDPGLGGGQPEALAGPEAMREIIYSTAQKHGIPSEVAIRLARVESNFDPRVTSPKGAQGLFQLMPKTAESLGVTNPFDPEQSANGGLQYLSQLLEAYGDLRRALAAYNWGPGNLNRHGIENAPPETRNYLRQFEDLL